MPVASATEAPAVEEISPAESIPTEQPAPSNYGTAFTPTETVDYSDPNSFRVNQVLTDEEEESMFNMFK